MMFVIVFLLLVDKVVRELLLLRNSLLVELGIAVVVVVVGYMLDTASYFFNRSII
jgi:hypothetical protein